MHQYPLTTRGKWALCLASLLVSGGLLAQTAQPMTVKRNADLKKSPEPTAETVVPLPANQVVSHAGERRGAWMQVRTDGGKQGWMRLFDLSAAPVAASGGDGGSTPALGGLFAANKPRAGTATLGIRGLDANDIAQAQPNPGAVTQGEKLRASEAQARQFAQRSGLSPRPVDDLPATRSGAPATNAN